MTNAITQLNKDKSTKNHPPDVEMQPAKYSKDIAEVEDQTPERKTWDRKLEFILSSVGYAVGLGNVWRFPYIAYKNGGGSFLIPYTFMIFFLGLPALFLESALGQYVGLGPTRIYGRLAPALKGIGFAMVFTSFFLSIYYNVIISWALFYMFSGLQSQLPWTTCSNDTIHCSNETITDALKEVDPYVVSPSKDYFNHAMLGFDKAEHSWTNFGGLKWEMVLCLAGTWTIICLALIKGIQGSSGKVVYFTGRYLL